MILLRNVLYNKAQTDDQHCFRKIGLLGPKLYRGSNLLPRVSDLGLIFLLNGRFYIRK